MFVIILKDINQYFAMLIIITNSIDNNYLNGNSAEVILLKVFASTGLYII